MRLWLQNFGNFQSWKLSIEIKGNMWELMEINWKFAKLQLLSYKMELKCTTALLAAGLLREKKCKSQKMLAHVFTCFNNM